MGLAEIVVMQEEGLLWNNSIFALHSALQLEVRFPKSHISTQEDKQFEYAVVQQFCNDTNNVFLYANSHEEQW